MIKIHKTSYPHKFSNLDSKSIREPTVYYGRTTRVSETKEGKKTERSWNWWICNFKLGTYGRYKEVIKDLEEMEE